MPCIVDEEARRKMQLPQEIAILESEIDVLRAELAERDAMLCGVLTAAYFLDGYLEAYIKINGERYLFSQSLYEWFNEAEVGFTWQVVEAWYADHKARDEARKAVEAAERARKREAVLAKLTPEERDLLGV